MSLPVSKTIKKMVVCHSCSGLGKQRLTCHINHTDSTIIDCTTCKGSGKLYRKVTVDYDYFENNELIYKETWK